MYCTKCGKQIEESAKFCTGCGTSVAPKVNSTPKKGFWANIASEFMDIFKHPIKLLPTIVLSIIWLIMPIITGLKPGTNIPIVRFFCTLTYANGGILGGFFGTVGGIFGKAVFATVVNGIVLSLCAKKNPFKGFKKGIGGVFTGGLRAISPLLFGGGLGLILYWFFNITSAPQNSAVAVVAAIAAIQSLGKQNGLLFGGVFLLAKQLSKGKAPTRITVNRVLTGLSAGFAIGFGLTFLRYAWVIFVFGILFLGVGIGIQFIGKNGMKKVAAATVLLFIVGGAFLSAIPIQVYAASELPQGYVDPNAIDEFDLNEISTNLDNVDGFYLELVEIISGFQMFTSDDVAYKTTIGDERYDIDFDEVRIELTKEGENPEFFVSGSSHFSENGSGGTWENEQYTYNFDYSFNVNVSLSEWEDNCALFDFSGDENVSWSSTEPDFEAGSDSQKIEGQPNSDNCCYETEYENENKHYMTIFANQEEWDSFGLRFQIIGVHLMNGVTSVGGGSDEIDDAVIPYRRHLTYSNGVRNKHGQPFPDLMDFDGDGDMDYADRVTQYYLVHNPDLLDTPKGAALVTVAIITMILGGSISVGISGGSSALSSLLSKFNLEYDFPEEDIEKTENSTGQVEEKVEESIEEETEEKTEMMPEEKQYEEFVKHYDQYITADEMGDLLVCDPISGNTKNYIHQEDGSYRQVENGQSYTKDEIRNDLAYAERNSNYFEDIDNKREEAVEVHHEQIQSLSEDGKKIAEMMRQDKEREQHEEAIRRMAEKRGLYMASEEELRQVLAREQESAERMKEITDRNARNADYLVKGAEYTKMGADIAADIVATADKTGIFKDVYSVTTTAAGNAGEVMAGNMTTNQALAKTAIDSTIEVAKNRAEGNILKYAINTAGDGFKAGASAVIEGKDSKTVRDEFKKGAATGFLNTSVDVALGGINSLAGSDGGTQLSEAGEAFVGDLIKNNLPEVKIPKEK